MALGNALHFVKQFTSDERFRKQCNRYNSKNELFQVHNFNEYEFEDAINMQLLKCNSHNQALYFLQVRMWISYI